MRRATPPPHFLLATCIITFIITTILVSNVHAIITARQAGYSALPIFTGHDEPTCVRFSPDGRAFVAEKKGRIYVHQDIYHNNNPTLLMDLFQQVNAFHDRGILGLALKPLPGPSSLLTLFVLYSSYFGSSTCSNRYCLCNGRLSKFTISPNNTVLTSEQVLLDLKWCQEFFTHSIGDVFVDDEGVVYVSAGEGANPSVVDYGQLASDCGDWRGDQVEGMITMEGGALRSQQLNTRAPTWSGSYDGTLLRLDDNGNAMPDNPLVRAGLGPDKGRIIAFGFRNPFRGTWRRNRSNQTELWHGDVGWNDWEEINVLRNPLANTAAVNLGWPCYEGDGVQAGYQSVNLALCNKLYSGQPSFGTPPYFAWKHAMLPTNMQNGCTLAAKGFKSAASTGVQFYRGSKFPGLTGAMFFGDYANRCVWSMPLDANGDPDSTKTATALDDIGVVDIQSGPPGDSGLYVVDIQAGTIYRLTHESENFLLALFTTNTTLGAAPLSVKFDSSSSIGPAGVSLLRSWDLNSDGVFGDSDAVALSGTYRTPGTYTVTLRLTANGNTRTASTTIQVAASASDLPFPVILSPPSTKTWFVGESISVSGTSSHPSSDLLHWTLLIHHCADAVHADACHLHYYMEMDGNGFSFNAPDHEYYAYLEIRLEVTTEKGYSGSTSVFIRPIVVQVQLESTPVAAVLTAGSTTHRSPFHIPSLANSAITLGATDSFALNGVLYAFVGWNDGLERVHNVQAAMAGKRVYTATYNATSRGLPEGWNSVDVGNVGFPGSAFTSSSDASTITVSGAGRDIWKGADAFHYAYLKVGVADTLEVYAYVSNIANTDPWAKAGIMIRVGLYPSSAHAMVLVSAANGVGFQVRAAKGQTPTFYNGPKASSQYWVRLTASKNSITAYGAVDGVRWKQIGPSVRNFAGTLAGLYVGLAVTSHDNRVLGQADFSHFTVKTSTAPATAPATSAPPKMIPPPPPPPPPPPVLVWTRRDVGSVGLAGSTQQQGDTFTIRASGTDIWLTTDEFHYAYVRLQPVNTLTLIARVASILPTNPFAKTGVMIRADAYPGKEHAMMWVSPGAGNGFQWRTQNYGEASSIRTRKGGPGDWVRIVADRTQVSGYVSSDGAAWTLVSTQQPNPVNMSAPFTAGLAVTSHNDSALTTAVLERVQLGYDA
eukprot:jgi/Chlat1/5398/Chrsp35S05226